MATTRHITVYQKNTRCKKKTNLLQNEDILQNN